MGNLNDVRREAADNVFEAYDFLGLFGFSCGPRSSLYG